MSGDGFPPPPSDSVLGDVLAYLRRRQANAQIIAEKTPDFSDCAADRARQLDIIIDDLGAGLHEGAAQVEAAIAAALEHQKLSEKEHG